MLPHGHFQNMKQSSMYLFHDLMNSVFILLYFLPMISYRFSSKYAEVGVVYIAAILVPIAVPVAENRFIFHWRTNSRTEVMGNFICPEKPSLFLHFVKE